MSEKVSQPGDLDKFVPTKKPLGDYPEKIMFAAGEMPKWKQEAYKLTPDNVYNVEVNKDGFVIDGPHPPVMDRDVTQPTHYTAHPSGIECITIAQHFNFNVGNAVKYLWRAGLKVPKGASETEAAVKDFKKAKKYIDFEIRRLTL